MAPEKSTVKTYHGVIVPMVTPLTPQGELDEPAVKRIIDHLVTGGVQGVFVLGTTGEGPSAPREMRSRLVHLAVESAGQRLQVYAGIGDTVVAELIDLAKEFLRRGVTAVVAQLPSYYMLSPDEQFNYFASLVDRIHGPLLLYDIPAAVHSSIDLGVVEHLRVFPNVVGIKDSSGDRSRLAVLLEGYGDDSGFSVLVGSTALASFGMANGADGFVPSAGNLNPGLCCRLYAAALTGDQSLMEGLQRELDALQAEISVPGLIGRSISRLKWFMAQRNLCGPLVFPPLMTVEEPKEELP